MASVVPYLSVVIPAFDEMANLQKGVLDRVESYLSRKDYDYEVLVVDDGSRDGTTEFLEKFTKTNPKFKIIKNDHLGKAGAVTTGMLKARGQYILFTDMDQATPIEELESLLPYFGKGYDVVIGSRSGVRKGAPFTRIIMARGMMMMRSIVVGLKGITDTQCGFKMFTRNSAQSIFKKILELHNGFQTVSGSSVTAGFDVELLFLAQKMGFKIKEVPVRWLYVETRRVNPIKDSIQAVKELFIIKKNDSTGKYSS